MSDKRAPVQGFSAGIPWDMHMRAYDAYCKKYGPQKALIDLENKNCRGGFHVEELDEFIPGWREELSTIAELQAENKRLRELVRRSYIAMHRDHWEDGETEAELTSEIAATMGAMYGNDWEATATNGGDDE